MTPTSPAAPMPHGVPMLDKDLGEVGIVAAIGAGAAWLVARLLNNPDEVNKLKERVIRLEARIGSDGDVGTLMHVLTAMQKQMDDMQRTLQSLASRRPE
jgi:uncharacterized coiled-coil protein SlyX